MTRTVRFGERFRRAADRLGIVAGSDRGRAVAKEIARLAAAREPLAVDTIAMIPPTGSAHVRRVPGRNLWIWYQIKGDFLIVAHVSSEAPASVDE